MNMGEEMAGPALDMTAMNVIVGLALLFAVVFFAAWAASPKLRAWIEQPNYRFQKDAKIYDEELLSQQLTQRSGR